jgi:hypothetical protein
LPPDDAAEMAKLTGYLTPVRPTTKRVKLPPLRPNVHLYHMKIRYREKIQGEIESLKNNCIEILRDGQVIRI